MQSPPRNPTRANRDCEQRTSKHQLQASQLAHFAHPLNEVCFLQTSPGRRGGGGGARARSGPQAAPLRRRSRRASHPPLPLCRFVPSHPATNASARPCPIHGLGTGVAAPALRDGVALSWRLQREQYEADSVRVLPVPAPASTGTAPCSVDASAWLGVRPDRMAACRAAGFTGAVGAPESSFISLYFDMAAPA